jgi:hypothetical protein
VLWGVWGGFVLILVVGSFSVSPGDYCDTILFSSA